MGGLTLFSKAKILHNGIKASWNLKNNECLKNNENLGQSLVYRVDEGEGQDIEIAGGPLTYQYRFKVKRNCIYNINKRNKRCLKWCKKNYGFNGYMMYRTYFNCSMARRDIIISIF